MCSRLLGARFRIAGRCCNGCCWRWAFCWPPISCGDCSALIWRKGAAALALLDEADRLAADGRFDEATHLLLQRSVGQIAEARPDLVEPSSTAREIAAQPALPEKARGAFAVIADRVERSLFALRRLSLEDWQAARAAYADFALAHTELEVEA